MDVAGWMMESSITVIPHGKTNTTSMHGTKTARYSCNVYWPNRLIRGSIWVSGLGHFGLQTLHVGTGCGERIHLLTDRHYEVSTSSQADCVLVLWSEWMESYIGKHCVMQDGTLWYKMEHCVSKDGATHHALDPLINPTVNLQPGFEEKERTEVVVQVFRVPV